MTSCEIQDMNASLSSRTTEYYCQSVEHVSTGSLLLCLVLGSTFLAWFVRRLSWQSHPFFNDKRNPPFVPYILPFIGSGLSFGADPNKFMKDWSKRLNSNIFNAYIGGKYFIFITDPFAGAHVINGRVPHLSWKQTLAMILRSGFCVSDEGSEALANNTAYRTVYDKHLIKTDSLENIATSFQESLTEKIAKQAEDVGDSWSTKSIMQLFCKLIYLTNTDVILGYPSLATDEFFDISLTFERFAGDFFKDRKNKEEQKKQTNIKPGYDAREKLIAQFRKIVTGDSVTTKDDTPSALLQETTDVYKSYIDVEDELHRQLAVHWATYTNAVPTTFWLVYHLLSYEDAYKAVKKEIRAIYDEKRQSKHDSLYFTLSDLDRMVHLDSILTETIRLTTTHRSFRFRNADKDFEMKLTVDNEKKQFNVKKGTLFLTSVALDHRDEEVFENATEFKWDRFVPGPDGKPPVFRKNGRVITRPVNPFGGGVSLCPGRRFALAEMKILMATMLLDYDIRFKDNVIPEAPKMFRNGSVSSTGYPVSDVFFEIKKEVQQK